jgi:hypothetical protein
MTLFYVVTAMLCVPVLLLLLKAYTVGAPTNTTPPWPIPPRPKKPAD